MMQSSRTSLTPVLMSLSMPGRWECWGYYPSGSLWGMSTTVERRVAFLTFDPPPIPLTDYLVPRPPMTHNRRRRRRRRNGPAEAADDAAAARPVAADDATTARPEVAEEAAAPQRAATHLVTCLLVNLPELLSLVTLLICSV